MTVGAGGEVDPRPCGPSCELQTPKPPVGTDTRRPNQPIEWGMTGANIDMLWYDDPEEPPQKPAKVLSDAEWDAIVYGPDHAKSKADAAARIFDPLIREVENE